jgi:hypothetical protein
MKTALIPSAHFTMENDRNRSADDPDIARQWVI